MSEGKISPYTHVVGFRVVANVKTALNVVLANKGIKLQHLMAAFLAWFLASQDQQVVKALIQNAQKHRDGQ